MYGVIASATTETMRFMFSPNGSEGSRPACAGTTQRDYFFFRPLAGGAWWYSGSFSMLWLRWLNCPDCIIALRMASGITSEFSVPSSLMRA